MPPAGPRVGQTARMATGNHKTPHEKASFTNWVV